MTVNVEPLPTTLSTRMRPVVLLDDLPADAQAQAGAAVAVLVGLLGRVERLEDQAELFRRDADAGVGDADLGHLRRGVLADLDRQPAAARHRLAGVDDQVEQDLLDLARHAGHLRPAVEPLLDLDAVLAQVLFGQDQHFLDQRDEVGHAGAASTLLRAKPSMLLTMVGGPLAALEDLLERLRLGRGSAVGACRAWRS